MPIHIRCLVNVGEQKECTSKSDRESMRESMSHKQSVGTWVGAAGLEGQAVGGQVGKGVFVHGKHFMPYSVDQASRVGC